MSVEMVLYHIAVLLVGMIIGTFVVAVIPLKSDAQSLARNLYLQGIALLFAICLALYYTLGHINKNHVAAVSKTGEAVASASYIDEFMNRLTVPLAEVEALINTYKNDEVI